MTLDEVIAVSRGRPCSLSEAGDAVVILHEGGAQSVVIRLAGLSPEIIQSAILALDMTAYPERERRFIEASKRLLQSGEYYEP